MKLLVAVPIYEVHKSHLEGILEGVLGLIQPNGWEKHVGVFVNNSSEEFYKEVRERVKDKFHIRDPEATKQYYNVFDVGEVVETFLTVIVDKEGKEKKMGSVCRNNKAWTMANVRNAVIQEAVSMEADWILFIDCDSIFHSNALLELLELEKDLREGSALSEDATLEDLLKEFKVGVISGLPVKLDTRFTMPDGTKYFTPSIYFRPENNPDGETRDALYLRIKEEKVSWFSCDGVGFGFALVPKWVFSKFRFDPEASSIEKAQDGTYFSEDYAYCLQLRDTGHRVFVAVRTEIEYAETPNISIEKMTKEEADDLEEKFIEVMREETDEKVISSICPKCGSHEMGFNLIRKEYDCQDCGHVWQNIPEESNEEDGDTSRVHQGDREDE